MVYGRTELLPETQGSRGAAEGGLGAGIGLESIAATATRGVPALWLPAGSATLAPLEATVGAYEVATFGLGPSVRLSHIVPATKAEPATAKASLMPSAAPGAECPKIQRALALAALAKVTFPKTARTASGAI